MILLFGIAYLICGILSAKWLFKHYSSKDETGGDFLYASLVIWPLFVLLHLFHQTAKWVQK